MATLSVAAVDPERREFGAVVASCIGSELPLEEVVRIDPAYGVVVAQGQFSREGRDALVAQLGAGLPPAEALDIITSEDFDPESEDSGSSSRQYALVDRTGRAALFTGTRSLPWAGHRHGSHPSASFTLQGNVLTGPEVLDSLERGFLEPAGVLGERLFNALRRAQLEGGGDSRCAPHAADAAYFEMQGTEIEPLVVSVVVEPGNDALSALTAQVQTMLQERGFLADPPPDSADSDVPAASLGPHHSGGCGIASSRSHGPPSLPLALLLLTSLRYSASAARRSSRRNGLSKHRLGTSPRSWLSSP